MSLGRTLFVSYLCLISFCLLVPGYVLLERQQEQAERAVVAESTAVAGLVAGLWDHDSAALSRQLRRLGLAFETRIRLVDRDGWVVDDSGGGTALAWVGRRPGARPNAFTTSRFESPAVERARREGLTVVLSDLPPESPWHGELREVKTLTVVAPCRRGFVHLSRSLVGLRLQQLRWQESLAGLLLSCLTVATLLAFALSRWVAAPVGRVAAWSCRIAAGDFDGPRQGGGCSEVQVLMASFEEMAARLARRDESQRRFVADASHELKTPLACMGALLDALDQGGGPDLLQLVRKEQLRLQRLVHDLLTLHRFEGPLPLEWVDLAEVVAEFGVAARVDSARVLAHPVALTHVLANLIDNARAASRGLVEVVYEGGCLMVRDDGPGIAACELPKIFDRFYRIDQGRARRQGGSGLGLAIVRRLMLAQGGRVEVESEPGVGTTFRLWFVGD